jgi:predicted DCC family thiol-disulfide oxidoreductase YuxK
MMARTWTGGQYSLFRALLGAYLVVHFATLLPWGSEVFSNQGMLADGAASPLFHLFPSVLLVSDAPWAVTALLVFGALCAALLAIGLHDRPAALGAWYVLACLFARNPLIANPALPFIGWMLLAHLFVPTAPWGSVKALRRADPAGGWAMPQPIVVAAWIVLALTYSYSGYTKLLSPSWVSGDAIGYVLQNPLARDYFLRDLFLALPAFALPALTWAILIIELLFAPLSLVPRLRPVLWIAMAIIQLGFLFLLNFADLTTPMLLFHLLTFDPRWIAGRRGDAPETIYYDGHCGFCHRVVRFILAEDRAARFRFAPLQSAAFAQALPETRRRPLPDSFVLMDGSGQLRLKSDAVIYILHALGGLWSVLGLALQLVPRTIRDVAYDMVGRIRHRLFRRPADLCPLMPMTLRARFGA